MRAAVRCPSGAFRHFLAGDCDLPAARIAGPALLGSRTFLGGTPSCYGGSLVVTQRGPTQIHMEARLPG